MRRALSVLLSLGLLHGCKGGQSAHETSDAASRPPTVSLVQESLHPGSTNAGIMPSLVLRGGSVAAMAAREIAADMEARVRFVSAGGHIVSGVVSTEQLAKGTFVVQPAGPLLADTWYDVTYPPLPISVGTAADGGAVWSPTPAVSATWLYHLGEGVVTRFYTGSAPQLREVAVYIEERDGGGGASGSFFISLSEPVSSEDLGSGGFAFGSSTPVTGSCLLGGGDCQQMAANGVAVSGFEYRLDSEVPIRFELALALSLRGVTRTVQGALDAGAVRRTGTVADGYLHYPMDVSSWRQRDPSSTSRYWSNAE